MEAGSLHGIRLLFFFSAGSVVCFRPVCLPKNVDLARSPLLLELECLLARFTVV